MAQIATNEEEDALRKNNEKERTNIAAPSSLSNILHSTFGMDHYPNYLYRWNLDQVSELEEQLLAQLKHVQTKKRELSQILHLSQSFHGPLSNLKYHSLDFIQSILHTKLLPFIQFENEQIRLKWDWNMIDDIMAEETDQDEVYSFPLFDPSFCDKVLQHTNQYMAFIQNVHSINQSEDTLGPLINARRSVLDWMNLQWLNDFLLDQIINPITKLLFQRELYYNCLDSQIAENQSNGFTTKERLLDWRHGYVIGYKSKKELFDEIYDTNSDPNEPDTQVSETKTENKENAESAVSAVTVDPDQSAGGIKEDLKGTKSGISQVFQRSGLSMHTDDSEITLNCCLNDEFEGGKLNIFTVRGKEYTGNRKENERFRYESDLETQISLKKGYAVIHRGRQFHSVDDVESGQRAVLIVWCRSLKGTRRENCPCCWLNRRNDMNCICGTVWN